MASSFEIGNGVSGYLDLLDSTNYDLQEFTPPPPDIDRKYRTGCGSSGTRLEKRLVRSERRPIRVDFKGATGAAAITLRDAFMTILLQAVAYQTGATDDPNYIATPSFLIRGIGNQSPKDIWTLLDFDHNPVHLDWDGLTTVQLRMHYDLILFPGQMLPGGV